MKRFLLLLISLPLVGCSIDQQRQQLARCIFDAEQTMVGWSWLPGDKRQTYVWLCMSIAGYQLNRSQAACRDHGLPIEDAALFAQCYEPRATTPYLTYRIERTFGR